MKYLILTLYLLTGSNLLYSQCLPRTYTSTWDWTTEDYDAYIRSGNTATAITLKSPFYEANNSNLYHFNIQPFQKKDFHQDDGWVLMRKNLGTSGGFANAVDNPSFILYNRHTGILRVFCAITNQIQGYNGAVVTLKFKQIGSPPKESALFSHFKAVTQPLESFVKKVEFRSPSNYSNQTGYWVYSDFVMAYDPCACYHETHLLAEVFLLNTSTFNFDLFGTVQQVTNSGSPVTSNDFNSIVSYVNNGMEAGNKVYKSTSAFTDNIIKLINKQNSTEKAKMSADLQTFMDLLKFIPKVGQAIGVIEFFVGGGNQVSKENITTSAFEANLKANGDILTIHPQASLTFGNPGSDNLSFASSSLPVYNNILGVFNLLESPKLEYVEYEGWENGYTDNLGAYHPVLPPNIRQYKVKEDLKYVVNPASNLEVVSLDVAVIMAYGPSTPFGIQGLTGHSVPVEFGVPSIIPVPYAERLDKLGLEIESWTASTVTNGEIRLRTRYLPIGCFNEQSFLLYGAGPPPDMYCKVNVRLKRTDVANAQDVTFIATYPISMSPSSLNAADNFYHWQVSPDNTLYPVTLNAANNPNGPAMPMLLSNIQYNLHISSTTLSPGTYQAWNNIYIGNNTIFPSSGNVTLIAGKNIFVDANVTIPGNVTLQIGTPTICDRQVTASTVNQAYCTNNLPKYNPNVPTAPRVVNNNNEIPVSDIVVAPNPFSDRLLITCLPETSGSLEIFITDIVGRQMYNSTEEVSEGLSFKETIDSYSWNDGVYIVTLKVGSHYKKVKTVKIRQ